MHDNNTPGINTGTSGNILIIDHNPDNLRVLTDVLSEKGYMVGSLSDSASALKSIQMTIPDLILLDMDGFEICRLLKSDDRFKDIPIIFTSAIDTIEEKLRAFEAGGLDYITKPFQAGEVIARVKTHIALRNMQKTLIMRNTMLEKEVWNHRATEKALRNTLAGLQKKMTRRNEDLMFANEILRREVMARKQARKEKDFLQLQLRQAQKMEALGTLTGGIAHDFNNLLTIIFGVAQLAEDDVTPGSEMAHNIEQIMKACQRASNLVNQILTFSRRNEEDAVPLNVKNTVTEAIDLIRTTFPASIRIQHDIQLSDDMILADRTQVHQILMNISTNALHAMETSGGLLEIGLYTIHLDKPTVMQQYPDLSAGEYVVIKIRDTGPGMEASVVQRIFEPFFTTKMDGKGTGLGLSVVHGIVRNHKGAVNVHSRPGKGTVFEILFPKFKGETYALPKQTNDLPLGSEHILLVDDEASVVHCTRQMLEPLGYHIITQVDPMEALNFFRESPNAVDLIITDLSMPDITGDKLASACLDIRPDIPVIAYTGLLEPNMEQRIHDMGMKGTLRKPFLKRELATLVRYVLDSSDTTSVSCGS